MSHNSQPKNILALITQALADPRRYEILKQIASQRTPLSLAALRKEHDIGAPTMSYHIKLLADANLIDVKRQGTRATVALRADILEQYVRDIERQLNLTGVA